MKLRNIGIIITICLLSFACKERYKNPDPAPAETAYVSSGKVGDKNVSFSSGVNGYNPAPTYYTSTHNTVSYKFGITTANDSEDHFYFNILDVSTGTDSNDVEELFKATANKSYTLGGENLNPITYNFSFYKDGVEYTSRKDSSGSIVLSDNIDLGDISAVDHKTGEVTTSRYVQFKGKLTNVKLYSASKTELLISNFEFIAKLGAAGDLKKKK